MYDPYDDEQRNWSRIILSGFVVLLMLCALLLPLLRTLLG